MRFAAPEHASDIMLSIGTIPVVDGFADVPDDATEGDLGGLAVNGFTLAPDPMPVRVALRAPATPATDAPASDA